MRTLKVFSIFCAFFFAFLALGQGAEKMDRSVADEIRAAISLPLPNDTPSVSGGGLVVEQEVSGVNYKIWAVYSKPGLYLAVGQTCDGKELELWSSKIEPSQNLSVSNVMLFDGDGVSRGMPFSTYTQLCTAGLIRLYESRIERSVVRFWQDSTAGSFSIGSEGMTTGGKYFISLLPLPANAVVILGRYLIAEEIQRSPTGSVVVFPQTGEPPTGGPTTITICTKGQCESTVFVRKIRVGTPGKG